MEVRSDRTPVPARERHGPPLLSTPASPGIVPDMSRARWTILALYTAGIFISLPYTPRLVKWSNARFGPEAALLGGLACAWWRWTATAQP